MRKRKGCWMRLERQAGRLPHLSNGCARDEMGLRAILLISGAGMVALVLILELAGAAGGAGGADATEQPGHESVQGDGTRRRAKARMDRRHARKKQAVQGHRVIDPGRHHDGSGEASENAGNDDGGEQQSARRAENARAGLGHESLVGSDTLNRHDVDKRRTQKNIHECYAQDSEPQGAGQIALGVANFACDLADVPPASEGEEGRHEARAERAEQRLGPRTLPDEGQEVAPVSRAGSEGPEGQQPDNSELENG